MSRLNFIPLELNRLALNRLHADVLSVRGGVPITPDEVRMAYGLIRDEEVWADLAIEYGSRQEAEGAVESYAAFLTEERCVASA